MKRARTEAAVIPAAIISSLARMQDGLNCFIDKDWRSKRTCRDWTVACTIEATELMDSYPWKWWKNTKAQPDFNNVKIELVDILHFALSGTMQKAGLPAEEEVPLPVDVATTIHSPLSDTNNAVTTFLNVIYLAKHNRFETITEMVIASAEDLSFNLVGYYVAKHTLNYIRQLGGYKDGTYAKVQQGKEDNELLHDCIAEVPIEAVLNTESYAAAWDKIMGLVYDAFKVGTEERRNTASWVE